MSEKLDKLQKKREAGQRHLRKAANDEKTLAHGMARLTRAERTHRLCTRGGMLETFIREPSLLTDNDVMELLTFLFHGEAAQKKLGMLIERRIHQIPRLHYSNLTHHLVLSRMYILPGMKFTVAAQRIQMEYRRLVLLKEI